MAKLNLSLRAMYTEHMITAFTENLVNMFKFKLGYYNVSVHSHQLSKKNSVTRNYKELRKKHKRPSVRFEQM